MPTRVSDLELHCIRDFLLVFQNEVIVVLMTVFHYPVAFFNGGYIMRVSR